ncbi:glycosyltransferase family 4 protein [Pontivivens ytuae]|uniref:Glycosyltransferase n=1 Tax=Pontivivens ytuae TaxID=2789856 RepID=A0A7S9LSV8_9RHOB|nr:glycosyltransferase family 4 protein [Pontivivens ytuae]QPH54684.1 glycosyltransferase [Pontivivens ytuae]
MIDSSQVAEVARDRDRRLTVLQLVPSLESGGVERGAIEIVQALSAAGHRALVASSGGRMEPQLRRAGGELIRLDIGAKSPWAIRANARQLAKVIAEEGVDIVHARSRAPAWAGLHAARATGVRFITTYHGVYNEDFPLKRRYNAVMAKGEPVIAVSDYVARIVAERHRVDPTRIITIPRGADITTFAEEAVSSERTISLAQAWGVIEDPRPIVLLPGRLSRWKGQEDMVAAASLLRSRAESRGELLDCQIVLVGDDGGSGFGGQLENAVNAGGLTGSVRLVGHCADMEAAYKLASVVVSASREPEAFGRVAVEAQAMGRPVIATAHGGALETVEDGKTGWLYPPGDVAALADAVEAALALDESGRAHMGLAARARIRSRFTVEAMQKATLEIYEGVV